MHIYQCIKCIRNVLFEAEDVNLKACVVLKLNNQCDLYKECMNVMHVVSY